MLTFDAGSVREYLWRAGRKGDISEDLRKALWHLERTESPYRASQLWDDSVHLTIVEDLNRWSYEHAGDAPILEAASPAIERIAAGDLRSAQIFAREALDHVNAGVSA